MPVFELKGNKAEFTMDIEGYKATVIVEPPPRATVQRESPQVARLYGPAVRCKSDLTIWRRLVLRFCIRL